MHAQKFLLRLGATLATLALAGHAQRTPVGTVSPATPVPTADEASSPVRDVHTAADGTVYALCVERNRPADVLVLDPHHGVFILSSGGFLAEPQELATTTEGELLVVDRTALGGDGALLRIDPRTGEQSVLSFGAGLANPTRVHVGPRGGIYVWDGEVVSIDPRTGEQTRWSGSTEAALRVLGRKALRDRARNAGAGNQNLVAGRPPIQGFQAPPKPKLPPETIVVIPTMVWIPNGPGYEDDILVPGGPFPLVKALRESDPNTYPVVSVFGDIPGAGMSFGAGDNDFKEYVAHWGAVPMRFAVVGRNEDARIREFDLRQFMNDGSENGGIADVRFENLTIEARFSSAVAVPKGHNVGLVRFYDCHFAASRENKEVGDFHGFGYKWGLRGHGRGRWDFRGCSFDPVEEHCIYIDSPQGDCYFIDVQHTGSRRTAIQVVNRSLDNPGPSGFGTLLFQNVRVYDLWGDGGSGISVAGHLGDLVFRDVVVRENRGNSGSHGGIVVWTDADPQKGVYLYTGNDGQLYSTRSVLIESVDVDLPRSDRAHIAISGVEHIRVDDFQIRGNRAAFSFDNEFGSPTISGLAMVDGTPRQLNNERIDNGFVGFRAPCPLSGFTGFQSTISVVENMGALSSSQIDARWCASSVSSTSTPLPGSTPLRTR